MSTIDYFTKHLARKAARRRPPEPKPCAHEGFKVAIGFSTVGTCCRCGAPVEMPI